MRALISSTDSVSIVSEDSSEVFQDTANKEFLEQTVVVFSVRNG